jgi:hypothetical protein
MKLDQTIRLSIRNDGGRFGVVRGPDAKAYRLIRFAASPERSSVTAPQSQRHWARPSGSTAFALLFRGWPESSDVAENHLTPEFSRQFRSRSRTGR